MATNTDLTNPIYLPNGIDTANNNAAARSDKIIRQGKAQNVETGLTNVEASIISWNFNGTITDGSNPGTNNLAMNNALKASATIISFHVNSALEDARFDEILDDLKANDKIIIQERNNPDVIAIYRITNTRTNQGAYDDIPVVEVRTQGASQFTNGAALNVTFVPVQNVSNSVTNPNLQSEIDSLQSKVGTLFPLAPDVQILDDWAGIYNPEQAAQNIDIATGYSLLADFRATNDRFESAGVTYTAGVGVSQYSGLSDNFNRVFGCKVTAPADKILIWLNDGVELIPFVDITAAGNIRVNNFTPRTTMSQEVTNDITQLSLASGTLPMATGNPPNTVFYTIPAFPIGATNTSQSISAEFDILVNGNSTGAGGGIEFSIPVNPGAQARIETDHTFNLGFQYNNRLVTLTIGHELQVNMSNYQIVFSLRAAPSDITLTVNNISLVRNYTAASAVPRVDEFLNAADGLGAYTFTGGQEFLLAFESPPTRSAVDVIPVTIEDDGTIHELNDLRINQPFNMNSIEVADDIEFRTFLADHYFTHSDLAHLLENRAIKWDYGLARLNEITVHSITEAVDLAAGTTIDGNNILRTWQDAQAFVAASSVTVTLPASTTIASFERCAITWHTGVGTASDNANRDYVDYFDFHQIVNHARTLVLLPCRGRGADNYGIQVTKPLSSATTLALGIINLNDAGGATLPAGSVITDVEFY